MSTQRVTTSPPTRTPGYGCSSVVDTVRRTRLAPSRDRRQCRHGHPVSVRGVACRRGAATSIGGESVGARDLWRGLRHVEGRLVPMATRSSAPEKRPGFFSQIRSLILVHGRSLQVASVGPGGDHHRHHGHRRAGGLPHSARAIWSIVLWGVTGLMFGFLLAMITSLVCRRMPCTNDWTACPAPPGTSSPPRSGATGRHPTCRWVSTRRRRKPFIAPIGRGGVVVVGEGARGRLTRLINDERSKVQRVASGVPVHVIYVGHGDDDVPICEVVGDHQVVPRRRSTATTMAAVIKRIESVSKSVTSLPIPKGIDPMRARSPRPR